uniref:Uncharacterized protein n=1 Tax=Ciona savignyi TaxID=51511 RepID=H2ZMT3_CIOSA
MALSYLLTLQPPTVSLDDVKLHIDIYVQNRLPQCGLETAKRRSDPSNQLILFSHLFTTCHQHNLLKDLFQVCISNEDDELLLNCLQSSNVPHSHEMLVLYHLGKSRYVEAIKSYQSTRHTFIMAEHNKETKQRQSTMSHLIQGYMDVLPQTYREAA